MTGVPAAKASVRTMPKLSPESDGAQSRSALVQLAPEVVAGDAAADVDPAHQLGIGQVAQDVLALGADHGQPAGDVLDQGAECGEQDRQALALLGAADEENPQLLGGRRGGRSARRRRRRRWG